MQDIYTQQQQAISSSANKVLRNTYMLLAMTMAVSAIACGISMAIGLTRGPAMIMSLAAIGLVCVA